MFNNKKGDIYSFFQSYGWVCIVLVFGLGIYFYYGFYEFGFFAEKFCHFRTGFVCKSPAADSSQISFVLRNQKYIDVQIKTVSFEAGGCSETKDYNDLLVPSRQGIKVTFECDDFPKVAQGDLVVTYLNPKSGLEFEDTGFLRFVT